MCGIIFVFSSRRRHTRCALVTGVQTCALPICDVADPDWQVARAHLVLHLIFAAPLVPPRGATLVNTGTSWRVHYYFRFVRDLKARHGICYIPFVHDLIPIVAAQYCAPGITEDFASWLIGAVRHADGFLVNSRATRQDRQSTRLNSSH